MTEAKRLPDSADGEFPDGFDTGSICYWRDRRYPDMWLLYLPGGGVGNLSRHTVTEHDDGSITVSPSILLTSNRKDRRRHGFLRRGVWEPCGDDIAPPSIAEA